MEVGLGLRLTFLKKFWEKAGGGIGFGEVARN